MSITERELLMLQDHLSLHATLAEKAGFYANQVNDQEIRQVFLQLQRGHQRHVDAIAGHLSEAGSGASFGIGPTAGTVYAGQSTQITQEYQG